jgi:hypothetical protein
MKAQLRRKEEKKNYKKEKKDGSHINPNNAENPSILFIFPKR